MNGEEPRIKLQVRDVWIVGKGAYCEGSTMPEEWATGVFPGDPVGTESYRFAVFDLPSGCSRDKESHQILV
jgi:hypothetical protein